MNERAPTAVGGRILRVDSGSKKVKHFHYRPMGPEGSGRLRLPDSVTSALEGGRLSVIHTGCF
jgi:hypothetical protein